MQLGLDVAQQRLDWSELVDRVRFAEELGFTGAWGFDHFRPMYGEGPGNCFEGMTTLAALSGLTSRIRLGLLVAGVTYRHPSVMAAEAVTIDHASGGRLELAVGAAWYEPEHRQLGIDYPATGDRFDLLEDQLEIFVRLFTGDVVSYEGKRVSLHRAQLRPTPAQRPHPPIWIGGSGRRRTLPLVARYADVWHSNNSGEFAELSVEVDRLAERLGRNPSAIRRSASLSLSQSMDGIRADADRLRAAGADYLICGWPGEGRQRIVQFQSEVAPDLVA